MKNSKTWVYIPEQEVGKFLFLLCCCDLEKTILHIRPNETNKASCYKC